MIQVGDWLGSRKTVDDGYPKIDGNGDANTKIKVDRNKQMRYADTMAVLVDRRGNMKTIVTKRDGW